MFDDYFIAQDETFLGIIDIKENTKLKFKYELLEKIEGTNIIYGIKDKMVELIDKNMKVILSMENSELEVKENYIKIYNENEMKYFDYEGKELSNIQVIKDQNLYANTKNGKWGYIDKNGNIKIDYVYDMVTEFNEYGYAGIKKDGKWGVINSDGKIVKEPIYEIENIYPHFIGQYYRVDLGYGEIFYMNEI